MLNGKATTSNYVFCHLMRPAGTRLFCQPRARILVFLKSTPCVAIRETFFMVLSDKKPIEVKTPAS
jgi:hypothetical protein